MATARQIAANQANSLRSTGPRSPSGKAASRANSLVHGLSGRGVVLPHQELDAIAARLGRWGTSLGARDDHQAWLVETIAVESVRVDRCRLHEVALRLRLADRAEDFWDIDRRLAAAELAARLPKSPETVSWQLQETLQGVELLIGRWEALGKTLAMTGTWDESQRSEALDLMGVRRDRRQGWTELVPDAGDFLSEAEWFRQHVECRLRDLRALLPQLEDHDAAERLRAMAGDASPSDVELKRLRRYERGCLRTLQWALAQLKARQRDGISGPPADHPGPDDPTMEAPAGPGRGRSEDAGEPLDDAAFDALTARMLAVPTGPAPAPAAAVPPDDGPAVAAEPIDGPDDDTPTEGPSPAPAAVEEAPARGLLKPVPLVSALRKTVPSNRRARRAARSRSRKG
jgi:hypothetical protein